jgi:hypothetical protein
MQLITPEKVKYWNGNKSEIRQHYEHALLSALLEPQPMTQQYRITTDQSPRETIEDEANIFNEGFDVLVTTAGNPKFRNRPKCIVADPVDYGILGARIAVYKKDKASDFLGASITSYQQAKIAQPWDWADVPIYESNAFALTTAPSLEACFTWVSTGQADYLALGANEVMSLFEQFNGAAAGLMVDPHAVIYYPMPLQIYCHPTRGALALTLTKRLQTMTEDGQLKNLFKSFYGAEINRINLQNRGIIALNNPNLDGDSVLKTYISPWVNPQGTEAL